jgi:hypothetical protein
MKTLNIAKLISLGRKFILINVNLLCLLILSTIIIFSSTRCKENSDECDFNPAQYIKNPDGDVPGTGPIFIALKCKSRSDTSLVQNFQLDSIIELSTKYKLNTQSSLENLSSPTIAKIIAKNRDSVCALIRFRGNLLGARGGKATIGLRDHTDTLLLYLSHGSGALKPDTVVQRYSLREAPKCVKQKGYPFYIYNLEWRRIDGTEFKEGLFHPEPVYYVSNE